MDFNLKDYHIAKVLMLITMVLIVFPLTDLNTKAQTTYNDVSVNGDLELLPAVRVDYYHKAQVSLQGKKADNSLAKETATDDNDEHQVKIDTSLVNKDSSEETEDSAQNYQVNREVVTTVTAYNPLPEQTDGSPCITANGLDVCKEEVNVIAANWLPFGTKVQIPDYFGDKVFEVNDRMSSRYNNRVDVLMYDLEEAKKFGKRRLRVVVLD